MITRREAILGLGAAAIGSATPSAFGLFDLTSALPTGTAGTDSGADVGNDAVDQRLSKALAELASRADSEEGVPVFLACINQVAGKNTKGVPQAKLTPLSKEVAEEMRENAAAWQRIRPNSSASDVARLIQVLAEQDFAVGGTEHRA